MDRLTMNTGTADRFVRVVLGSVLIAAGLYLLNVTGCILGIIGLIPLITGLAGWCPVYALLKLDTCKLQNKQSC